ncbi:hypothetical protein [Nocardioides lianchengensis]|uniref:Uncharacterized protein n=1 Tax=Nocardioides lianchengensis TaxID=1045774 RepID=A0A1G6K1T0_9ACTN|nr:hypothetical protein [Nocardioides lianchengensis]NYG08845.1 hypothetical protein [Nocardioides lianchengensis]SDC24585.1 hypothetical protein SAMN05421872_101647 [Nocardioides lianchengensis]
MRTRGVVVGVIACLALSGCGESTGSASYGEPFTLPVGATEWDVTAPAWYHDGTLHVGEQTVELGAEVDRFVLGATGAYWMSEGTLMFTSVEGATQEVEDVRWGNLAVSADHSVFATVDQSRGPTDRYDTHVIQAAAFDTRTGEQLYRTPDEEPDDRADLADLYSEIMPLLQGVSDELLFFDGATIRLADGSREPTTTDADGIEVFDGYAETLFPLGYHVGIEGRGAHRELSGSTLSGVGLLSPDRSTIFDVSMWPTPAVVYDEASGDRRRIDAPWDHFTLAGWSDDDTFYGVAEQIDENHLVNVLRARQVVTCELRTLACTPVSPVIPTDDEDSGEYATFLVEGSDRQP